MIRAHMGKGKVWFHCPACKVHHSAIVDGSRGWSWNGDAEFPTISPSLLVAGEIGGEPVLCHSFVTEGQIRFLPDCNHLLAGKTVEIPEWAGFNNIPGADATQPTEGGVS